MSRRTGRMTTVGAPAPILPLETEFIDLTNDEDVEIIDLTVGATAENPVDITEYTLEEFIDDIELQARGQERVSNRTLFQ